MFVLPLNKTGKFTFRNGDIYEGEMKNSRFHGYGNK